MVTSLDFSSVSLNLPPHNIDAEESILGGILLDDSAIAHIADKLQPEAFYVSSHQIIYKAALALHKQGLPTDLVHVSTWLHDHKKLEKAGGLALLTHLVENTVSAVNIDRYAALVMDKFFRRELIQMGNDIAQLGHASEISQESLNRCIQEKLAGENGLLHKLKTDRQRSIARHSSMISEVEQIELEIENPSLKYWELQNVARKFGCSIKVLEECWYRHLVFGGSLVRETWGQIKALASEFQEWLLHGFLPKQGLILLHAAGGVGKTRLFYDWAFCLATGTPWNGLFNVTAQRRKILLIQTDELPSEMLPALETRGFDENCDIEFVRNWNIENVAGLNKMIEEYDPDHILIDSLNSVSNNSIISENDAAYARPVLALRKLSELHSKLIFLIHHSNREGDVRGSTAIKAACSMEMKLARDPQFPAPDSGRRILTIGKTRSYRRPAEYSIEFDAETGQWNWLGETSKQETEDTSLPLKERIVNFLAAHRNQRFEYEELHHELGGGLHSVRRATCELASDGIISRVKHKRRSLFFLMWDGEPSPQGDKEPNYRYDQQLNHDHDDHNFDHNQNAQPVSTSESHDHVIIKNELEKNKMSAENPRSHDREEKMEARNVEPASNTVYDRVCDRVCDRAHDQHDRECDRDHGEEVKPKKPTYMAKAGDRVTVVCTGSKNNGSLGTVKRVYQLEDESCEAEVVLDKKGKIRVPVPGIREFCLIPAKRDYSDRVSLILLALEIQFKEITRAEFEAIGETGILNFIKSTNEDCTLEELQDIKTAVLDALPQSKSLFSVLTSDQEPDSQQSKGSPVSTKNLPKKGDRVRTSRGAKGEVTLVRTSNPRYEITWDDGTVRNHDLSDLEILDARKIELGD
jgi:replicative DNA helicase